MKSTKTICFLMIVLATYGFLSWQLRQERAKFLGASFVDYTLPSQFTGPLSLEFKGLTSDFLLFKFMTFVGARAKELQGFDEYHWTHITRTLDTITDLDPYFWDAYLFAEMFLTWDARKYDAANRFLLKAKQYLTNDYRVPYYLGFNHFFFLKDNVAGAQYLMEASRLPGSPYYLATLAARLSVYAFQHRTGILFLEEMLKDTQDERIAQEFRLRIKALEILDMLEQKVTEYQNIFKKMPSSLNELISAGLIDRLPEDPYGGEFILMKNGRVYTTSKMLIQSDMLSDDDRT